MEFLNAKAGDELLLGFVFSQEFEWHTQDTLQDIDSSLISAGWSNDVTLYGTTHQYRAKNKYEDYGPFFMQHSNWIKVIQDNDLEMSSGSTIASIYIWLKVDTSVFP